eukprot:CAMPEP_0184496870 /NCGR_PEP_ID=MMETSP0113_2-20130426/35094_1 /TAXON_ID=91329 /ORGANISM="Norrisiella sphaerica, Strain BC52" /LENGTH=51 /DNA_ID=CAMNT_0026883707 /DNA_START=1 /DNA_END=153 /DNA_ORIENTATION=-
MAKVLRSVLEKENGKLRGTLFVFDFDKTLTTGLGTAQKIRGGTATLEALEA